jgi:hypothetical protein
VSGIRVGLRLLIHLSGLPLLTLLGVATTNFALTNHSQLLHATAGSRYWRPLENHTYRHGRYHYTEEH